LLLLKTRSFFSLGTPSYCTLYSDTDYIACAEGHLFGLFSVLTDWLSPVTVRSFQSNSQGNSQGITQWHISRMKSDLACQGHRAWKMQNEWSKFRSRRSSTLNRIVHFKMAANKLTRFRVSVVCDCLIN
jgi:hypothetical protein